MSEQPTSTEANGGDSPPPHFVTVTSPKRNKRASAPPPLPDTPQIEDDGEDDFDDEAPPPPAQAAAPAPRPKISFPAQARTQQQRPGATPLAAYRNQKAYQEARETDEEFGQYIAGLDFTEVGRHSVHVERVEPQEDMDGRKCGGMLEKFTRPISWTDLQGKYGGGIYNVKVYGPNPDDQNKIVLRKVKKIVIAGEPKMPASAANHAQGNGRFGGNFLPDSVSTLISASMQTSERAAARATDEAAESRRMLIQAIQPKDDFSKYATLLDPTKQQTLLAEERRHQEALRSEERRQAEESRRLEREERRYEREESERRHVQMLAQMKTDSEARIASEKLQHELAMKQMEMQIARLERSEKDKQEYALRLDEHRQTMQAQHQESMAKLSQLQIEQMQSMNKMQVDLLIKQLDKKGDALDQFVKFKGLLDDITGDNDAESTVERVLDKVGQYAPGIMAAAGLGLGLKNAAQQQQTQQRRVAPGSVAVVEAPDERERTRIKGRRRLRRDGEARAELAPAAAPLEQVAAAPELAAALPEVPKNELTDFVFPTSEQDIPSCVKILVCDLDLAIQRDLTAGEMLQQVIVPFRAVRPDVTTILTSVSAEQMIQTIDTDVPSGWAIAGVDGQKKLVELHGKLLAGG